MELMIKAKHQKLLCILSVDALQRHLWWEILAFFEGHRLSELRDMQPVPDVQTFIKLSIYSLQGPGLEGIHLVRYGHDVPGTQQCRNCTLELQAT